MRTIGLLGGMSWQSSSIYYRLINQGIQAALGSLHSAKAVLLSVDFENIEQLQRAGDWAQAGDLLAQHARSIEATGAEGLLICTNTMHKVADQVQAAIDIPLLHIADATAGEIKRENQRQVGLLGTRFTMEDDFYTGRLMSEHSIETLIPDQNNRRKIHQTIYQELCNGVIKPESKSQFLDTINDLQNRGAQGIIAGCTEITLLITQRDISLPLFDTTAIHAQAAVDFMLNN